MPLTLKNIVSASWDNTGLLQRNEKSASLRILWHYIFDSDAAARPQTLINKGSLLFVTLQTVEDVLARPVDALLIPSKM